MSQISQHANFRASRIAVIYALFGLLWILFSDQFLLFFTSNPALQTKLQTLKGWLFVIVTAGLLFALVRRALLRQSQGENILNHSELRFRALLDSIPDLIWLKDAEGIYLSCNATFERFFGAREAEIVGRTDYDFVDKELADFFREHDRKAMAAGKPSNNEEWITFADTGERVLLLTTKVPINDTDGQLLGVLGVGRDITELREAEERKLFLENQLQQTQKIESIGQLAGGVAHDFNNMLGVILGRIELAMNKVSQGQSVTNDLEAIQKAAEHSAELTRQLLTFARKQAVVPKVLDLNATVTGMLTVLQRTIGENICLSWNPAEELWPVRIDPVQMDQILVNLCVNARDAIQGTGNISIRTMKSVLDEELCAEHPDGLVPGEYVQLSVSDDGCGMTREVQDHIFEPFFTTKKVGAGTGLGLSSVYGAVKQNRGFVTVYSEPDIGTVFNIYLPREAHLAKIDTPLHAEAGSGKEKTYCGGSETLLLVEDDPMLLELECTMLEAAGYRVLAAESPERAIILAGEQTDAINLLITDVIMPEMNGRELSEHLKRQYPDLRVLFLSGYTAEIISPEGVIEEGMDFLQKPVTVERLTVRVRDILDRV